MMAQRMERERIKRELEAEERARRFQQEEAAKNRFQTANQDYIGVAQDRGQSERSALNALMSALASTRR